MSQNHTKNLNNHLYEYRNQVPIPPLGMVDDQIAVSKCGLDSALATSHLNSITNVKKLQFGADKCHKMHVGETDILCTDNTIDTWSMITDKKTVTSMFDFIDVEGEPHKISSVQMDSYLGDLLQHDGKNNLNITERLKRGDAAINQICNMLNDLCLGDYYFEAAGVLRNSLLLSTLLSNSESWYNLTKKDIKDLESIDVKYMRRVLSAHSKTPIEMLYLENGFTPIRFILMSRRLNFLWYILQQKPNSLLNKFFSAQLANPKNGDWVLTVKNDLVDLQIDLNFDDIQRLSKSKFKKCSSISQSTPRDTYKVTKH